MKVRLTKRAREQVDAVLVNVAANSPQGAEKIRAKLRDILTMLESHPLLGHPTTRRGFRRLSANPYPYFID